MASTTPPLSVHPFERKVETIKPSKIDIINLIMDYLITEGYPATARSFAIEANIPLKTDFESINERVEIMDSIHKGDLKTAIEKINDLNPQLLDTNEALHFSLLRLQLIELIRACTIPSTSTTKSAPAASTPTDPPVSISTALAFATEHLAPRAPTNPTFLADLERTMALLIFPPESLSTSPQLAELIDPALRKTVAARVNKAILDSQGVRSKPQIRNLVQLRAWSEKVARDGTGTGSGRKIDLPAVLDLGLDGEAQKQGHANGTSPNGTSGENATATNGAADEGRQRGDTAMAGNTEVEGGA